jgi:hypothetical protein
MSTLMPCSQENLDLSREANENGERSSFLLSALIEVSQPDEKRWVRALSLLIEAGGNDKDSTDASALRPVR